MGENYTSDRAGRVPSSSQGTSATHSGVPDGGEHVELSEAPKRVDGRQRPTERLMEDVTYPSATTSDNSHEACKVDTSVTN